MKRERPEDLHHHHQNNNHHHNHHHHPHHHSNGIFSSTPHHHQHQFPLHPPHQPPSHPHPRPPSSNSDDTTNNSYDSSSKHQQQQNPPPNPSSDGASIEVVRRPRGRPPGSKNKPKPPSAAAAPLLTPDSSSSSPSMGPYILELPSGVDIVESTARFCRRRNVGLCILSGHGVVSNVSLKQPSATPGATVSFHGRFDILSISATVVPNGGLPAGNGGAFTLFLAGPQGQVVGGIVVGPLISAGTVYLIAATFESPMYVRLQPAEQEEDTGEDGGGRSQRESSQDENGGGATMYSYQPADVIWAPTPRQPPPPY